MSQLDISNLSGLRISPSNEDDLENDPSEKKAKYPKSVFFIIATELSERFSYYGMRAVLTIYMRNMLNFNEDKATTFYHTFLLMCYGLPIVWGIVADSFLGKYTTIWIVSLIFALGNVILTLSSIPPLNLPAIPLTMIGLFLMALGTSGMKPCVAPFGGEQFKLPGQAKYLQQFFSVFFFAVTVGNMISTIITPVFRRDIQCFGIGCYPLAFGVPAITMLFAVGVFVSGKPLYKINPPAGNMLVKVVRCITHALVNKKYSDQEKSNWLDYADDTFDAGLIKDIKMLLRVLVYYIPIPMFFALYEQLGSRWTLMATRMDGRIGNSSFIIKPDQMQVSNAILMFIFIPIFQAVVYPVFRKCRLLKRPLQRMGVGGFIAALSFFVAGVIELQIEKNHYIPPSPSETHLKFVNTLPCPVLMSNNMELDNSTLVIGPENAQIVTFVNTKRLGMTLTLNESCDSLVSINNRKWVGEVPLMLGSLQAVFIFVKNDTLVASISAAKEDFVKSNEGNAKVRIVINGMSNNNIPPLEMITLKSLSGDEATYDMNVIKESNDFSYTSVSEVPPGEYSVINNFLQNISHIGNSGHSSWAEVGNVDVHTGGSYLYVVHPSYGNSSDSFKLQMIVINTPNEIHMLWLIPQYVLMAWAEILFIVSGMEFSFTQAPKSMKSVLQSLWHLMNAFGNVIVILSAQTKHAHSQATEFFEFAGAMLIDMVIFCLLAMRYKYVEGSTGSIKDRNDNKE